ncbi:MAG: hypothetical protein EHM63_01350 [Actinobacteria bacterium]|nr:MAG: hypothetical protein EHM63_01350 [Actinomycetota bacterium]
MTAAVSVRADARGSFHWTPVAVVGACVGLAALSLLLPVALGFDPWTWIVWGREVVRLDLDTTGGASWKPLPVVVTAVLAPFGDAAPMLWALIARSAGLLLLVGVFELARRFAGVAAGAIAASLMLLTPDPDPRFLRILVEAHGAPIEAALAIWAIDRHLEERRAAALLLGATLALMRPEAWPFLCLYALWLWWREPRLRPASVIAVAVVPVLWFGGDWWGSSDPWHGAEAAQVGSGSAIDRFEDAITRVFEVVVLPAWIFAGAALVSAVRRRERTLVVIGIGTLVWCALVVVMAVGFKYAALSRFLLPAAALVCVLAGIGVVRTFRAVPLGGARVAFVVLALAFAVPMIAARAVGISDVVDQIEARGDLAADLDGAIAEAGGVDAMLACITVAIDDASLLRPQLAWELDVPIRRVVNTALPMAGPAVVFAITDGANDEALRAPGSGARSIVTSGSWSVYDIGCRG